MKSYDKTLTRLILTLTKLSNDERPTIKELVKEFGVGVRTIQRDIYERLAYFPIEKDSEDKLKFIDGFTLDRSTLDNDEMMLVYLSLSQIKGLNNSFETKINTILSKLLLPNFITPYHIKTTTFEKLEVDSKVVQNIKKAIEQNLISSIKIKNQEKIIYPFKIVSFSGIWYLLAKDKFDNKVKSFMLSDIKNIKFLNNHYSIDKPIDEILSNVHSAWFEDGSSFKVTILVHEVVAYYFKKKKIVPTQENLEELENGDLIVSFVVSHYEDIDNLIKAWLPHIEIIDPIDYKEQITNELQKYLDNLISSDITLTQ
jgi:predicted DNA-binding transcriptional regulator YafY